jgi:hypothetical protein
MFSNHILVGDATGGHLQGKELVWTIVPSSRRILDRTYFKGSRK